ncbi:Hsp70 family protein [Tumidithrix helvetica PCC 7403]|uniref:Hsp70 family protein n=1 Tax=Tumidithrix helvetica TaxID=3457545 RepID=UPI003CB88D70
MTVVAIDFGTSNTAIATFDPVTNTPRTVRFPQISRCFESPQGQVYVVPSLVFVQSPDSYVFGEQVRSQRLGFAQPHRFFQAFKRDMAADFRPPSRLIDGVPYDAEAIADIFITSLWQQLALQRIQPTQLIFTVPVGAFESYVDWFRDLAKRLILPPIKIVDESTAAALGYAVQKIGAVVLVIDFGGGTLDISLVRTVAPNSLKPTIKAEVLAKSDAFIGGIDVDTWIAEYWLRSRGESRNTIGEIGWLNLLELAERIKVQLSQVDEAKESWFDDENFISYELSLHRDQLTEILESHQLLEQLRQAIDEVLAIALNKGLNKAAIEQVLLVGGSCLLPAVQQLVVSYFGRTKVKLDKTFEAVAHGALLLGQVVTVDDYLRHGYAIRLWEPYMRQYSFFTLFEKGTKYPCQRLEPLTLQVATEGQREIRLDIGEVADTTQAEVTYDAKGRMTSSLIHKQSDFRSLADLAKSKGQAQTDICVAHLDPPGQTGMDRISVVFEVNEQRVLLATVKDLLTEKVLVDRVAIAKLE